MQRNESIYKPFYLSLLACLAFVVCTFICIPLLHYNPSFDDVWDEVKFDQKYRRYEHAEKIALDYAIAHPDRDTQIRWLMLHFSNEEHRDLKGANAPQNSSHDREDAYVYNELEKRANSDDPYLSEQGMWGLALAKSLDLELDEASSYLDKCTDTVNQYVLYTKAVYYRERENYPLSLSYINKALDLFPDHASFVRFKINLLQRQDKNEELYKYLNKGNLWTYTSASLKEEYYFTHNQWGNYWFEILTHQFRYITFPSLLGALLIALFWGYYLYRLDIYNADPIRYMVICFTISGALTYSCWFLYKMFEVYLEADINGHFLNDLLYSVFTIGLIEEGIKIIPLLIMIFLFKKGKEPYDYIKYACSSALGFAFIENIQYLDNRGVDIMHMRLIIACFGHLLDSCIVGYILAVNHFKWKRSPWLITPPALVLAALSHGLYDVFLISPSARHFWLISILIIILGLFLFHGFINNTLNNSGYYDKKIEFPLIKLVSFAFAGSFFVLNAEYILTAAYFGEEHAYVAMARSVISLNSIFVGIFLVTLNSVTIVPGGWLSILHFFRLNSNRYSSGFQKGNKLTIYPLARNEYQDMIFPVKGTVVRTVRTTSGRLHLIQLDESFPLMVDVNDHVFVKLKNERNKEDNVIAVFLIRHEVMMRKDFISQKSLQFIGWAKVEFEAQAGADDQ